MFFISYILNEISIFIYIKNLNILSLSCCYLRKRIKKDKEDWYSFVLTFSSLSIGASNLQIFMYIYTKKLLKYLKKSLYRL